MMTTKSVIAKRNDLINASYSLSIAETRVILICLSKIKPKIPLALDHEFTVTARDFDDELGISSNSAYENLQSAVDKLWSRSILIDPNEPKSMVRWITKKATFKSSSSINIAFSPQIIPYLTELSARFTTYKIKDVAKFSNAYSLRVYELLVQFKGSNERKISVLDFRAMLDLREKYTAIKDLKKRVLTPALADINDHSNINVKLFQEREGREISHFIFKYNITESKPTKANGSKQLIPRFFEPA